MPRLTVHGFTISLDGYGAGPINRWSQGKVRLHLTYIP